MSSEQAKQSKPIYKKWWFWLISVIILISILASLGNKNDASSTSDSDNTVQEEISDFELLDWEIVKEEYSTNIVGKVKNNTDEESSYVQITFNLYDESEALVGTAMANVNNLEAGGIWKFEAICMEEFKTAKFKEITNF